MSQPALDPGKSAAVADLTIRRDRIHITLQSGTLQFTPAANRIVWGAAFQGQGRVRVEPPDDLERQQLRRFTGNDVLDMQFSEAVFCFTDDTYEEISRQVQWADRANPSLTGMFADRLRSREENAAEVLPALFTRLLSGERKRSALFVGDLKTEDKGWVHVSLDALAPEECTVGKWTLWKGNCLAPCPKRVCSGRGEAALT
ncbi:MAG: hypothetical protein FJW35_11635, partial [Acidobacteria bacterium]|nr:hypothetical protein [Acidobacteriota bacterium]